MAESNPRTVRVGILVPPRPAPNMVAVLTTFGRMMDDALTLDLVQAGNRLPNHLEEDYGLFQYPAFRPDVIGFGSTLRACYRYATQERPDVLMNVAQPQTLGWIVAWVGQRVGIPSVVRMTGETFRQADLAPTWTARLKVAVLHGLMARWAYRLATRILALGSRLQASLIEQGYLPAKVHVLPQPFDPSPYRPLKTDDRRELKRTLGLNPDAKIILYVGRLSWLKGTDRLLQVIQRIEQAESSHQYQFCLIGRGDYETRFRHFDAGFVRCLGAISHAALAQYYQAADLFIFPSRTEGLPNVILEALAAGLPVVASPVGEVPHYVSQIADNVDDFVEVIRSDGWQIDPLPAWFDWQRQRSAYHRMFKSVTGSEWGEETERVQE